MHFDTDNEGHGGVLKHPIVSTALYLTGDAGGPTLVTTQRAGDEQLASAGYLCTPNTNRILMFDGTLLHAVLPGSGIVPGADEATASTSTTPRRISLMIAFWPSIRERPSPQPSAARPFPYKAVKGAAKFPKAGGGGNATWPALFDWPVANDAGGRTRRHHSREARQCAGLASRSSRRSRRAASSIACPRTMRCGSVCVSYSVPLVASLSADGGVPWPWRRCGALIPT